MRIAIEINGVLRNTLDKIQQTYQKYMIDKTDGIEDEDSIVREIKLPIDSLELRNHFTFIDDEELYSFLSDTLFEIQEKTKLENEDIEYIIIFKDIKDRLLDKEKNIIILDLINYEKMIAEHWENGKIRGPVHLSDGNEDQLIEIFKRVKKTDWVFSTWRSHYHALLKGICPVWLENEILDGKSITICSPGLCVAIVVPFTPRVNPLIIPYALSTLEYAICSSPICTTPFIGKP
jgi:hypothetical protein